MNIKELANFVRIVEMGSLSRAAVVLNVAQQALGLQVRGLEAEFGQQLLIRHSRGVAPTDAGKILLTHARLILHQVVKARQSLTAIDGPTGHVSLGMTTSANGLFLARLFSLCRERHPNVTIDVTEATSGQLRRMILSGEIEIACLYSDGDVRGLSQYHILDDEWVLVGSGRSLGDHGVIRFCELEGLPLVLPSRVSGMRLRLEQEARNRGVNLNVVIEVQSENLMKQLIEQGVANTVLPNIAVRAIDPGIDLRVARIIDPAFPCRTRVACRDDQPLRDSAAAVKSLLVEIATGLKIGANEDDTPTLR